MAPQRSEEEQDEKGFTVSDKRLFTREGARRAGTEEPETPPASAPPSPPRHEAPRAQERQRPEAGTGGGPRHDMPAAELSTLVAMLANNAMMLMGQLPDPITQQRRRDLGQAQHMIDMLMMLREKTQGNLTAEEDQLMQDLLPQLQMAFVQASRQVG